MLVTVRYVSQPAIASSRGAPPLPPHADVKTRRAGKSLGRETAPIIPGFTTPPFTIIRLIRLETLRLWC